MNILHIILTIIQVLCAVGLVAIVMLQTGKNGLSSAIAGGSQDTYLNKNKNGSLDKMLASATKWIALAWILLTLSLSFF